MTASAVSSSSPSQKMGPTPPPPPPGANQSIDELIADLNKSPLFMTSPEDADPDNPGLEALRALAYEGTPSEVAARFKGRGNECARKKRWRDAREFYSKAIGALDGSNDEGDGEKGEAGDLLGEVSGRAKVVDLEEEEKMVWTLKEACWVNSALCNLEMKNYGMAAKNAMRALELNKRNTKAYYRLALALYSLAKIAPALQAAQLGLSYSPDQAVLLSLRQKILEKQRSLEELERQSQARTQRAQAEKIQFQEALTRRGVVWKMTGQAPVELQQDADARAGLEDPLDASSELKVPVLLLYPTAGQSELIKRVGEKESLGQHLEYILPVPWDKLKEFGGPDGTGVDCFVETAVGGLRKVGRRVEFGEVIKGGVVEVKDGLICVYVIPKGRVQEWIEEFKKRKGR